MCYVASELVFRGLRVVLLDESHHPDTGEMGLTLPGVRSTPCRDQTPGLRQARQVLAQAHPSTEIGWNAGQSI